MVSPMFSPFTRSEIFLPTMTSNSPGVNMRPSTSLMSVAHLERLGVTPRKRDVGRLVVGLLGLAGDDHDFARRQRCAAAVARDARVGHDGLRVADVDPRGQLRHASRAASRWRCCRAGGAQRHAGSPADIDAITTTAATTSAMPKMASSVTFQRWPRLRMLYTNGERHPTPASAHSVMRARYAMSAGNEAGQQSQQQGHADAQ